MIESLPARWRFGSKVTIKDSAGKEHTYTIVGSSEADPSQGKISNESPVGQALLGRKRKAAGQGADPFRLYQIHCRQDLLTLHGWPQGRRCILHQAPGFSE